jgi:hypothetical protein
LGDLGFLANSLFVAHGAKAVINVVSTSMQVVEKEEGRSTVVSAKVMLFFIY